MKKSIFFLLSLSCLFLTGCYDMTDIENIKSISVVGVANDTITYCAVSTTPDEKIFDFDIYEVDTDNIYDGMNEVSLLTGKEASLSHLEAVIFDRDCSFERLKNISGEIANGVESHPKVMTAISNISVKELFDGINIPSDTSLYKIISDVLDDKFAAITSCNMLDMYYGIKYSKCAILPVINLDESNNIYVDGSICINDNSLVFFDKNITRTIDLLNSKNKPVFYPMSFGSTAVNLKEKNIEFDKEKNEVFINLSLVYNISGQKKEYENEIINKVKSDLEKIIEEKNHGFDVLDLKAGILKKFYTNKSFEEFENNHGGEKNLIKNIDYEINISIKKGDF